MDGARDRTRGRTYRMGEIAEVVGLSRQTLHHYARLGLIRPVRVTPGGHRYFGGSVFRRIAEIQRGKESRTLREMQARAERRGAARRRPGGGRKRS